MTNPSTTSKRRNVQENTVTETPVVEIATDAPVVETPVETPVEATVTDETPVERIPEALSEHAILADFCRQYLAVVDEIAGYNKEVLAESDSDWTSGKVLAKAREFAHPDDATKIDADIKGVYTEWERLLTETAKAKKAVLDTTSKKLGITLNISNERNPELEAPMKERRKLANEIGTQLEMIAKMTTNENASAAVKEFLEKNPLPAVGRDQARTFGNDEKATPKYRVQVVVTKDGETVLNEAGFTKAALGLTKFYKRGEAIKSDTLRAAWEKAGNSVEKTVTNPVEFEDNGLQFSISKK